MDDVHLSSPSASIPRFMDHYSEKIAQQYSHSAPSILGVRSVERFDYLDRGVLIAIVFHRQFQTQACTPDSRTDVELDAPWSVFR